MGQAPAGMCPEFLSAVRDLSRGGCCCTFLFQHHDYANLRVQPYLLPCQSCLLSHSRGEARTGISNPVKPLLLIMPDRASSLSAMPAAGWMLLFLSGVLSLPHPRGISYPACSQLPSLPDRPPSLPDGQWASWTKRALLPTLKTSKVVTSPFLLIQKCL